MSLACVLTLLPLASCSRTDPSSETDKGGKQQVASVPSDDEPEASPNTNPLDPSRWILTGWAANSLDDALPASEAKLKLTPDGLQVTTYDGNGPIHVIFRDSLGDEFEIRTQIIQPSVEELRNDNFINPSRHPCLIGFRGTGGGAMVRTHLQRKHGEGETFDVVVRASQEYIYFTINGQKSHEMRRAQSGTGHFFIETPHGNQLLLTRLEVNEDLEPDPVVTAAIAARAQQPQQAGVPSGFPMMPPTGPGFVPPGFGGQPNGFVQPNGFNPSNSFDPVAGVMGEVPAPSRLEPLIVTGSWTIPSLGNQNLDTTIAQDVRLESSDRGVTVSKTTASGGFWLQHKVDRDGDFTATYQVSLPSMQEMQGVGGPMTLLALGVHAASDGQRILTTAAPPPLPTATREFQVAVQRAAGRVTVSVNNTPTSGALSTNGSILLGLYLRGGIRFSINNLVVTPPLSSPLANDIPKTRVWTDITGKRQTNATFLKIEGEVVHFRRSDGETVQIPLAGLCDDDQKIARQFAAE